MNVRHTYIYIQTNVYSAKNRENESEGLTIISTLGPTFRTITPTHPNADVQPI